MEVWGLETFLFSIGPFYVSGFGVSQMKGMPYGGMSFAGSLGRNKEVWSLVLLEVLLGQASGGMSFSLWGMVVGCVFGRTFGEERRLFVIFSPLLADNKESLVANLWDSSRMDPSLY